MKTILYFEWKRNKKTYISNIVVPILIFAVLFVISLLLDRFAPALNYTYMRWPDMVKDLFGLPAWNKNLYGNLWQILALFYPFFLFYTVMSGLADSIVEEERLETVVYLKNLSIDRSTLMLTKGFLWIVLSFVSCLVLGMENALFFGVLKAGQMVITVFKYYTGLFLVSIMYMAVAVFVASYSKWEKNCEDRIFGILLIPFLLARLYALIGFFADILMATEREGVLTDNISMAADYMEKLTLVSPIAWCWPSVSFSGLYLICSVAVTVIMVTAGYGIYIREGVIYRKG